MNLAIRKTFLIWFLLTLFYNVYSQNDNLSEFLPVTFEGSTVVDQVYSPGLEGNLLGDPATQPVRVFLPPGYELYPNNRYPVVYFLNGYPYDYNQLFDTGLLEKLNNMFATRIIAPMIVVAPNGKNAYLGCMYANSFASGNWEDYIVLDVVQHVDKKYRTLNQHISRGLSGHSMGGYGTMLIGMKHPSVYSSIALIGAANLDFETTLTEGDLRKEYFVSAAQAGEFRSDQRWEVKCCFAQGVAFVPDSSTLALCRLPFDNYGNRIDSTWQEWAAHYLSTVLPDYKDSLLKLNGIQIYIGSNDNLQSAGNEYFHDQLLDEEIKHEFEVYEGGHAPNPVLDDMFLFFSDHLTATVPSVRTISDYYLESTDTLAVKTDMDGRLYLVPYLPNPAIDSIYKYKIAVIETTADALNEIQLSEFEYGRYLIFSESKDSAISNIPVEFWIVPDTSPPEVFAMDTVQQGDAIQVSLSRDGTLILLSCPFYGCSELSTLAEILDPPFTFGLIDSLTIPGDQEVNFNTDNLSIGKYMIYGFDRYGIVSEPYMLEVIEGPDRVSNICTHEIELYPNPANNILTLYTYRNDFWNITISSINGKTIFSKQMEGTTHHLDLSSFQKGVYFIIISSKDFVTTRKIVKL